MSERWKLERGERGDIVMLHKCNHEGHWIRYTPDAEAMALARLAAQEERAQIAGVLTLDYIRHDAHGNQDAARWALAVSERIERGEHWRTPAAGGTDAK